MGADSWPFQTRNRDRMIIHMAVMTTRAANMPTAPAIRIEIILDEVSFISEGVGPNRGIGEKETKRK